MVNSHFESILKEFESFFNCPLPADSGLSCKIEMGIGITVQIELDARGRLVIASIAGTLSPGRYRDLVIRHTLKANAVFGPSTGVFGFSSRTHHLIHFLILDPNQLSQEIIFRLMPPFIDKTVEWQAAISENKLPILASTEASANVGHGIFGLIH